MEVSLVQYLSKELLDKSSVITSFSNDLNKRFEGISFGEGLNEIVIGIVCVGIEYESFFKIGKPKYTGQKVKRKIDIEIDVEKTLEYRVKVDFDEFKSLNDIGVNIALAKYIINSLDVFEIIKIPDFDVDNFKQFLKSYFEEKKYLEN